MARIDMHTLRFWMGAAINCAGLGVLLLRAF